AVSRKGTFRRRDSGERLVDFVWRLYIVINSVPKQGSSKDHRVTVLLSNNGKHFLKFFSTARSRAVLA
ncbi:hypothetical protein NDU88_000873, partial [Pleurodeles waltl]